MAQLVKNLPVMRETWGQSLGWEDPLEKGMATHSMYLKKIFLNLCYPCGSVGKESACSVEDLGSVPGLGRSLGEEKGNPLQYSGLENSMDCTAHGVTKSQTRLSDFHLLTYLTTLLCFFEIAT